VEDEAEEVTLVDESGAERRFRLHDAFDVEGTTYYLMEAADDPDMVLLLKETGAGLESVDEEEFNRVITELDGDE
jgi:uncharacterized protein YrzB (UPF0473 family)